MWHRHVLGDLRVNYQPIKNTIYSTGSESPFEDEVYCRLAEKIGEDRLEQQYKVGGFRIDIVVKPKLSNKPLIAIECDGAKYHSNNEAYAWDMFRQSQLEKYGLMSLTGGKSLAFRRRL